MLIWNLLVSLRPMLCVFSILCGMCYGADHSRVCKTLVELDQDMYAGMVEDVKSVSELTRVLATGFGRGSLLVASCRMTCPWHVGESCIL